MNIEIFAAESLGVRGLCCRVDLPGRHGRGKPAEKGRPKGLTSPEDLYKHPIISIFLFCRDPVGACKSRY